MNASVAIQVLPEAKDDEELMQSVAELVLIRKGLKRGDNG